MPPIPLGRSGETLAQGFNQLGWHWWPSDMAIATQPYDGRDRCINLGACGQAVRKAPRAALILRTGPMLSALG